MQLQAKTDQKVQRIKFASDEYFNLVKNDTVAREILALGKNVRYLNQANEMIEVYE